MARRRSIAGPCNFTLRIAVVSRGTSGSEHVNPRSSYSCTSSRSIRSFPSLLDVVAAEVCLARLYSTARFGPRFSHDVLDSFGYTWLRSRAISARGVQSPSVFEGDQVVFRFQLQLNMYSIGYHLYCNAINPTSIQRFTFP